MDQLPETQTSAQMAVSVSRRRSSSSSRTSKKGEPEEPEKTKSGANFCKFLTRIPIAILLLFLVYVLCSSTTFISGNIFHVCISSRKLNSLYCLSAGTHPSFDIPVVANASISRFDNASEESSGIVVNRSDTGLSGGYLKETGSLELESNGDIHKSESDNATAKEEEIRDALKNLKELLAIQRSWAVPESRKKYNNYNTCQGGGIYVYDLPSKFNRDLFGECNDMSPWDNFCKFFKNGALGEPVEKYGKGWYQTHQYSLEPIFHSRVLKHPCRVSQATKASLFYVPFYGGLDVLRWHFKNVSHDVKDSLGLEVVKWLRTKKSWIRKSGRDHVFVLGKISWDFRRREGMNWGSIFLELPEMQNPMKLLIEREPWRINDIAVPHPSYFHPSSDSDIVSWQEKIMSMKRRNLVGFAGAARPGLPENIRSILIEQCTDQSKIGKCRYLNCSDGGCGNPESVIDLFLDSEFCLQPPGDSPTRKSVFDSLISGCIPVLFNPYTAYYQYAWHLPEDYETYSVYVSIDDLKEKKVNVIERLMELPPSEREGLRSYIVYELLPTLVYGDSEAKFEKFEDAFTITINNLLERVKRLD